MTNVVDFPTDRRSALLREGTYREIALAVMQAETDGGEPGDPTTGVSDVLGPWVHRVRMVVGPDDELWMRDAETGLWHRMTGGGMSRPTPKYEFRLRQLFSYMTIEVKGGVKPLNTDSGTLRNVPTEIGSLLYEAGKVARTFTPHRISGKPLVPGDPREWVAVRNGFVNALTRQFMPLSRDIFTTAMPQSEYRPELQAELEDWALPQVLAESFTGDGSDQIAMIQQFTGYCFALPRGIVRKGMQIVGPRGCGKGTYGSALAMAMGSGFQKFDLAALASLNRGDRATTLDTIVNARVACDMDSPAPGSLRSKEAVTTLLKFTENDDVSYRMPYGKTEVVARPQSLLLLLSNPTDRSWNADHGSIAGRWLTVQMQRGADYRESRGQTGEDPNVKRSILTDPNLPALMLLWALDGWADVIRAGYRIGETEASIRVADSARTKTTPLDRWIEDKVEYTNNLDDVVTAAQLRLAAWCWVHEQDISFEKVKSLINTLPGRVVELGKSQGLVTDRATVDLEGSTTANRKQARVYRGIRITMPDTLTVIEAVESAEAVHPAARQLIFSTSRLVDMRVAMESVRLKVPE